MCAGSVRHPRKIALIGASGFIGRRIAEQLCQRGDVVVAVVRPRSPRRSLIPADAEVHEALLDPADSRLSAALAGVEGVVYAAGAVRGCALKDFEPANVHGLEVVTKVLGGTGSSASLVLLSSLAASEPELSDYARSKRLGERVLEERWPTRSWTILRPTAVYGPGDRELRPVFALMRRGLLPCLAGPDQRLSFLHVDDLARAVLAALDQPAAVVRQTYALDDGTPGGYDRAALAASLRTHGRTLNVSVPRSVLALSARVNLYSARCLGRAPMLTPGKVAELTHARWVGDNSAFTAATGWAPWIGLAAGTRALFDHRSAG